MNFSSVDAVHSDESVTELVGKDNELSFKHAKLDMLVRYSSEDFN